MFLRHNFLSVLWAMLIVALSFLPGKDLPQVGFFHFDKLVHLVFYLLLFVFTFIGWRRQTQFSFLREISPLVLMLLCSLFGFLIECGQHFLTSDRYFDLNDALANTAGAVLGLVFSGRFKQLFLQHKA